MWRNTIYIILALAVLLYLAEPQITLKPFSVKFNDLPGFLGTIFLIVALSCFKYGWRREGNREARQELLQIVEKVVNEKESDERKEN